MGCLGESVLDGLFCRWRSGRYAVGLCQCEYGSGASLGACGGFICPVVWLHVWPGKLPARVSAPALGCECSEACVNGFQRWNCWFGALLQAGGFVGWKPVLCEVMITGLLLGWPWWVGS